MTPTKPHKDAVWIRLRGAEGWGCACMAAVLPKVEDEMLALGLIHVCLDVYQWAYNPDKVDASAGTHDLGGVIDVGQHTLAQRKVWARWGVMMFPREHRFGWTGGEHGHGVWVQCPHEVEYVRWQVQSGMAGGDGLGSSATLKGRAWRYFEHPTKNWAAAYKDNTSSAALAAARVKVAAGAVTATALPIKPPISLTATMRGITGVERGKTTGNLGLLQQALLAEGLLRADQVTRIWDQPTGSAYDAYLKRKGIKRGPEGRPTLEGFASLMGAHGYRGVL